MAAVNRRRAQGSSCSAEATYLWLQRQLSTTSLVKLASKMHLRSKSYQSDRRQCNSGGSQTSIAVCICLSLNSQMTRAAVPASLVLAAQSLGGKAIRIVLCCCCCVRSSLVKKAPEIEASNFIRLSSLEPHNFPFLPPTPYSPSLLPSSESEVDRSFSTTLHSYLNHPDSKSCQAFVGNGVVAREDLSYGPHWKGLIRRILPCRGRRSYSFTHFQRPQHDLESIKSPF